MAYRTKPPPGLPNRIGSGLTKPNRLRDYRTESAQGLPNRLVAYRTGSWLTEPNRFRWCHGSPVHRYSLYALQWIVEINGKPTPDLDAFTTVAKELKHGEFVRVRTVNLNGKPRVFTLKQDLHYWPTWELRFDLDTATWRRHIIKSL